MTLGEWLNRVILDDGEMAPSGDWEGQLDSYPGFGSGGGDDDDALREVVRRLTDRLEAAEHRSTLALTGVDQSVLALSRRLDSIEDAAEEDEDAATTALTRLRGQHDELIERIRKLERQGPSLGGADPQAVKALEGTIGKLAGRLYETERDVRNELDNLARKDERRQGQADRAMKTLTERVEEAERRARQDGEDLRARADNQDKRVGEVLSGLQDAARNLQSRIIAAENATHRAAEALTGSQERLDARLRELEARTGDAVNSDDIQRRFDSLGRELADLIRETRADCARQVAEISGKGGDAGRLEHALTAAESRLAQAETRQSAALTRIAEEVGRLSRAVDGRIAEAERRLEGKFSETEARRDTRETRSEMEARLDRVRQENASAVRKIGEQVAKLGESLSDRVHQAEQRSAQAVEAAGERMAEVVEKLETRRGASEADLEGRIRASEERTAQRIEDAMKGVHTRLDQARGETADALSPVQRAMTALADRLEAIEKSRPAPAGDTPAAPEAPKKRRSGGGDDGGDDGGDVGGDGHSRSQRPDFSKPLPQPPGLAMDAFEEAAADPGAARDAFVVDAEAPRSQAPRRKAAAAEAEDWAFETKAEPAEDPKPQRRPARLGASADADFLENARKTVRANRGAVQWDEPRPEPGAGRGRMLLIGAGVLGFAAVAAAAGMLALEAFSGPGPETRRAADPADALSTLFAEDTGAAQSASDPSASERTPGSSTDPASESTPESGSEAAPQTALRTAPPGSETAAGETGAGGEPAAGTRTPAPAEQDAPFSEAGLIRVEPATLEAAARAGDPVARYQLAVQQLEAGAVQDAARLMARAAEQGVPAAMRRYALMLQAGDGVTVDREASRAWMVQAAEAGNVQAMHDAGGMFINAGDAPDNQAAAARWFEQGALHGVRDSQFNMALLYQEGFGVPVSPADAYAWFTIAADAGDSDAAARAQALRPELTPEARRQAQAAAAGFTPRESDPSAQGVYPAQPWDLGVTDLAARAQALLGELGYDPGPADGVLGDQTRRALVRFQRDAGIEPGAPLTADLIARLERAAAS
ncbi:MAG: peptidoglycan-binding protein [Oceanicaulis sp.]